MVDKRHSFAERRRSLPNWDSATGRRTSCYCYLSHGGKTNVSAAARSMTVSASADSGETRCRTNLRRPYLRGSVNIAAKGVRFSLIAAIAVALLLGPLSRAAQAEVDAASVQRSIDRGITFLRKSQNERGGWEEFAGQSCGLSALCTLALLNSGVARDDPDIVQAMRYLRGFEPNETYSVALQTLVYCQLGAAGDLPRIRRNVQWLVGNQKLAGTSADRIGSWDYGSGRGSGDPSNAQFAILALGAAQDRGVDVDPMVFERAREYWIGRQRDGGWAYGSNRRISGSMTCAGIASLIITGGRLSGGSSEMDGDRIRCCGGDDTEKDPVEEGLAWLGRNFTLQVNPGGDSMTFFYYLYALERVGRLSGRRFIGDHDWYREGAERLLGLQDQFQGHWAGTGGMENRDVATSFALLFLSKGKRQVVIGRLRYPDVRLPQQWQQHPDSLRQLVRHIERDWGRDLTWQTIDADKADLEDLLQTPVIVISGRSALRLKPEFADLLREYIDQGGCILFEGEGGDGCGDASGFESSVRGLCQYWFEGAKLDRLPPNHPIWFAEHRVDPTALGKDFWVYGVQACCRTAVFYVPKSLSCRWELSGALFHRERGSAAARSQIGTAVRIGQNLVAYATGRELKDKLDQRVVLQGDLQPTKSRSAIRIAMLGLGAGGEEARRALPNAAGLVAARVPIEVSASATPVGFNADQLMDVPFLWIHGRTDFTLDDTQREVLAEYVQNGGIILGSAVCGSEAFADGFRREMALVLPDSPLRALPGDHEVLRALGGFDISSVTIRTPAGAGEGIGRRAGPPPLEVAVVDNVVGVFFSPLDLSCALESPNSVQCPGYSTEDAAKIVANLVLYGLQQ